MINLFLKYVELMTLRLIKCPPPKFRCKMTLAQFYEEIISLFLKENYSLRTQPSQFVCMTGIFLGDDNLKNWGPFHLSK